MKKAGFLLVGVILGLGFSTALTKKSRAAVDRWERRMQQDLERAGGNDIFAEFAEFNPPLFGAGRR